MDQCFNKVKKYLVDLEYEIVSIDEDNSVFIVNNADVGICNLIVDCEYPILIFEQHMFNITKDDMNVYKTLLQMNREIVHGAFVLDESGIKVIFRDTLQLENLDLNEMQGTLNSLEFLLCEFSDKLIELAKVG